MRLNGVKWPTTEPLLRSAGSLEYGLSFMFLRPFYLQSYPARIPSTSRGIQEQAIHPSAWKGDSR